MKCLLLVVAMGLFLTGCSENAHSGPTPFQPTEKNPRFVKATSERPPAIPAALVSGAACQVDSVNDGFAQKTFPITEKTKVTLVGWAADIEKGTVPRAVFIKLDGPSQVYFEAISGLKRSDVVSKKQVLTNCGWEAFVDLSGVSAGTYKVQVIQMDGSSGSTCNTGRSIVIN